MTYNDTPIAFALLERESANPQDLTQWRYQSPHLHALHLRVLEAAEHYVEDHIEAMDLHPNRSLLLALNEDECLAQLAENLGSPEELLVAARAVTTVCQDHDFITNTLTRRVRELYPEQCKKGGFLSIHAKSGS